MSDESKNVFTLVPKSKSDQGGGRSELYLKDLEAVIDRIRAGSNHVIILVDDDGLSSYISDLYPPELHWEASKLASTIMMGVDSE